MRIERAPATNTVFDIRFANMGMNELLAALLRGVPDNEVGPRLIFTANVDHVVRFPRNSAFKNAYQRAWAVTADGMPVYLWAKFRGAKIPERIPGSDLFCRLMERLGGAANRLFFVCSNEIVANDIVSRLCESGLSRGSIDFVVPPFDFESDERYSKDLACKIRNFGTTHLFFGVGAPKSEVWLTQHAHLIGNCYALSIGASLEFYTGKKRRAPRWMRTSGMEWIWRLATEPRRLWWRYLFDAAHFPRAIVRDLHRKAYAEADGEQ